MKFRRNFFLIVAVVGLVMFRLVIHLLYTVLLLSVSFSEWEYMYRAIILPKQNKTKTKIRKRACLNINFCSVVDASATRVNN